jgi:hypothetical protein
MADRKAVLTAVLVDAVSGPAKHIKAEISGIGQEVGKVSSVLQGIGQGIGQAFASGLSSIVSGISSILPNLLDQGHQYLALLQQVQLETGMTAEQTSGLVGTMRAMGVPTDDIATLLSRLAQNLATNEGRFAALGIATRSSSGDLLSAYDVIENTRKAISEHGAGLLSTAAAQELFGRSGYKLIEFFQATDAEVKAASETVKRWGGIVNDATIKNADHLGDTVASFRQGVTDIGVNIAAAVDPYLSAFVDSFAKFVQSHLNEIVNFAVGVVNIVTGFVSGLFGITSATDALAGSTDKAGNSADKTREAYKKWLAEQFNSQKAADGFAASINGQIKAIDAHVHALEVASEQRRAIRQRDQLSESLAAAQSQLADLRGDAPFTEGLSNAEQQLAIQKHAQDVIDAEKDVADKRKALGDFAADQKDRAERELLTRQKDRLQELLTAHKASDAAIKNSGLKMFDDVGKGGSNLFANLGLNSKQFAATASASFQTGVDAARGFVDILLGTEHIATDRGEGSFRTGGVVGALSSAGGALDTLGAFAAAIPGAFQGVFDAFTTLGDVLNNFNTALGSIAFTIHDYVDNLMPFHFGPWKIGPFGINGAANGAFVPAQPGGVVMRLGEGGQDEFVLNRSQVNGLSSRAGGGHTYNVHFDMLTAPNQDQIHRVVRLLFSEIDEQMAIKADNVPVGIRGFRGAQG